MGVYDFLETFFGALLFLPAIAIMVAIARLLRLVTADGEEA